MEQSWFEMKDIRRRSIESAAWIPLRADRSDEAGTYGHKGYKNMYFGVGTLAVPLDAHNLVEENAWNDIGICHTHRPHSENGSFQSADHYPLSEQLSGLSLVLDQHLNGGEHNEWHLHQDLVIGLGLKREGDTWLSANEGYLEVARLRRDCDGKPILLECRAEHLKDYLCALAMSLVVASYHEHICVSTAADHITWAENPTVAKNVADEWEGSIQEIHEGGQPFGGSGLIVRVSRTDIDSEVEIPELGFPTAEGTTSKSRCVKFKGVKLYVIKGALWRVQRLAPARHSPRTRCDELMPTVSFITNSEGRRENKTTLSNPSRWLWFQPHVIPAILQIRGASLVWHTRDTGHIRCSPDYGVHFGVNHASLINVYAKDIGMLPDWQQQIWAGHNVSPDGRVSKELLAAQMEVRPAATQAPEAYLHRGLAQLRDMSLKRFGASILREHADIPEIIRRCHRFRVIEQAGLFALAKDLARVTADALDIGVLRRAASVKESGLGSLKLLERLVAAETSQDTARQMLGPLVGIYDLRLADAHLVSKDIGEAMVLAGVDSEAHFVFQGFQIIQMCVATIYRIAYVIGE